HQRCPRRESYPLGWILRGRFPVSLIDCAVLEIHLHRLNALGIIRAAGPLPSVAYMQDRQRAERLDHRAVIPRSHRERRPTDRIVEAVALLPTQRSARGRIRGVLALLERLLPVDAAVDEPLTDIFDLPAPGGLLLRCGVEHRN